MKLFFFHHQSKSWDGEPAMINLPVHENPHNTNEGSEFLDDAIRMKDQPLMYTKESVAPGCPEGLL